MGTLRCRHIRKKLSKEDFALVNSAQNDIVEQQPNITLVVSHCNSDLVWIKPYMLETMNITGVRMENVVIYSKCQKKIVGLDNLRSISEIEPQVIPMPNVGRNDHTFAHYTYNHYKSILENDEETNDNLVVFLKDNAYAIEYFCPFEQVYELAKTVGFSCIPIIKRLIGKSFGSTITVFNREELGTSDMKEYESNKGEEYGESESSFQTNMYKDLKDFEQQKWALSCRKIRSSNLLVSEVYLRRRKEIY